MKDINKNIGWIILVIGVLAVGTIIKNKTQDNLPADSMEQAAPVDTMTKEEAMVDEDAMEAEDVMVDEDSMEAEGAMMEDKNVKTDGVMVEDKMMDQDESMMESSHLQVELELSDYQFSQKTIMVEAGQKVTVKLKNINGFHDFVIDELKVASKQISVDQEDSVTFTVPESAAGQSYEYYCSVGSHRELGMVGVLQVK
jgi:plastocyanin